MAKAFSYVRFSTPEQSKGDSARRQEAAAIEYAAHTGLDLDAELTFKDLGVSAYHGDNAETGRLGDFLAAVKSGIVEQGSYLLVESLDRISRQTARRALRVLEDICEAGVNVVTLSDGKIYSQDNLDNDPMSLIMSLLIFVRGNEESSMKSKRLKSAWSNKRAEIANKPLTGRVPEWLRLIDGKIQIIPDRADIVAGMFADYLKGKGAEGITKSLNDAGVEPWGRGRQKAGKWHKSYVQKILNNNSVFGEYTPYTQERVGKTKTRIPQETIKDYFPLVIDKLTFARAQELRSSKVFVGRKVTTKLHNIFYGVAKCPKCGVNMIRISKGNYSYLICGASKVGKCERVALRYDQLEPKFIEMMLLAIPDMPNSGERHNEYLGEIARLRMEHTKLERGIKNLVEAVELNSPDGTTKSLMDRITALEIERGELDKQIKAKALESRTLQPTSVLYQRKSLIAVLAKEEELDRGRCNALLGELCESIVFQDVEHVGVTFKNGVVLNMDFGEGGCFNYV